LNPKNKSGYSVDDFQIFSVIAAGNEFSVCLCEFRKWLAGKNLGVLEIVLGRKLVLILDLLMRKEN